MKLYNVRATLLLFDLPKVYQALTSNRIGGSLTEFSVNKSDPLFWWMKDTFVHQVLTIFVICENGPYFSGMSLWHSARMSPMTLFKQESTNWFRINAAHLFTPWVFAFMCNNFHAVTENILQHG